LVNTSEYEGFPNTFVQALSHGVPVVSLNVDPDGIISSSACGFFAQGNLSTLISRLRTMLSTPDDYALLQQHAYTYAKRSHDITRIAEEYAHLFRSLV
jgi:glycosyltransferase involved in cell wall biosynthesis